MGNDIVLEKILTTEISDKTNMVPNVVIINPRSKGTGCWHW
ncbi:hypothetical protein [Candidatus Hodgkinia cicadicola]